ncbi:hypothetical protein OIU77_012960 [Salix suchowensis]|uniref:Reverse transcriptase zinc-binding domain-containing protein n=1 Tax=Salix suchowensis TaxID=1278906 RepID=A0ABQ9A6M8_9ROSI|nr:hypothetical protein OIU77_012960 [Salix suchowensis]
MQFWNTGWVRKEYEVVDLMKREGLGRNGGDDGGNSFANHLAWKQVWPMNVHGKIKVFIWALHNSISGGCDMKKRTQNSDPIYC